MTTDPDARIFVSYARSDGRDCTKKLSNRIEDAGLKLWRDLSDLEGGRGWWEQIQEVLQHPKLEHLVLVMTKGAVKSKYVREEWRLARKEGKNVIPVIGTPDLDMTRLPAWMRAQHFIDTENDEQWQRFLAILKGPWRPRPTRFIFQKPSENFVPREKHLQQIKHALQKSAQDHSEDRNKEPAIVSVIGVTGSGKTELVRASCADPDIQDLFYDGIYWLQFDESPDTKRLAAGMLGEFSKSSSPYEQEETIYAKLSEELTIRNMRMLIVIDNVCHKENLEPFLQGGPNCVRLVTAQRLDVLPIRASIISPVDQMTEDEAVEVLQYGLSAEYKTAEHKTAFARLAKDLGYWPMLLALVNGYAQSAVRARATVDQTLGLIRNILANKGITGFDVQDTKDRTRAIYKASELTLNRLNRTEKSRCTELVIFSEDTDVPITAVKIFWKMTGNLSKYESQDLCQKLYNLSLLSVLDLKATFFAYTPLSENF